MSDPEKKPGAGTASACPICAKPADQTHNPFCSRRCADLDLGLWLKGAYRIPAIEPPDDMSEGQADMLGGEEGEDRD
jgi:endogenous inhibitor of DNA gyrase (YacG/DUF329 family)